MNLVIIYGPPAVGKLTVGKALEKKVGYKLLHNHLSYDLANSVFNNDKNALSEVNMLVRLLIIDEAAKRGIEGIIMTYVYASPIDDKFVKMLCKQTENIATLLPVKLTCTKDELLKRVLSDERKNSKKISNIRQLKKLMKDHKLFESIPFIKSIIIDNTNTSPKLVVKEIIREYNL